MHFIRLLLKYDFIGQHVFLVNYYFNNFSSKPRMANTELASANQWKQRHPLVIGLSFWTTSKHPSATRFLRSTFDQKTNMRASIKMCSSFTYP